MYIMYTEWLSFPSSLPKYKTSEDFKGFAIVEFSTQEAATNAIEVGTHNLCNEHGKGLHLAVLIVFSSYRTLI